MQTEEKIFSKVTVSDFREFSVNKCRIVKCKADQQFALESKTCDAI